MYKIVTDTEVSEEIKSSLAEASSVFIPIVQLARAEIPSLTLGLYFPEAGEFTIEGFEFTDIDWGDGQVTGYDGDKQYVHAYAAGTRIAVKIYGIVELPESIFAENQNICSIATYLDIPAGAFSGCTNLFDVNLSEGCAVIDDEAFFDTAVKYIKVPRTVVYLGNCVNMSSTVIELTQPDPYKISISDELFKYSVDTCTLIVPYGSFEAYVTAHPVKYDVPDTPQTFGLERPETAVTMAMERRAVQPEVIDVEYPYDAPLVIVVDTTLTTAASKKLVALYLAANTTVDWGDGSTLTTTNNGIRSHDYASEGQYTIKLYGTIFSANTSYLIPAAASFPDNHYGMREAILEIYSTLEILPSVCMASLASIRRIILPTTKQLTMEIAPKTEVEFVAPNLESIHLTENTSSTDGIRQLYLPNLRMVQKLTLKYLSEFDGPLVEDIISMSYCDRLARADLPNIKTLGALTNNSSLVELNLGNNLQSIGDEAFKACTALENIVIPSCKTIGDNIFNGCSKLKTVVLPDNLEEIYGSSIPKNIEEITIPASVKTIVKPFNTTLSQTKPTIYLEPLVPPVLKANPDTDIGDGQQFKGSVYVKPAAYDLYKNNVDWKKYNIIAKADILDTPVVQISKSGIAQWVCANAVSYKYLLDGVEYETTETAVQLTAGQVIQVKGIGDGTYFVDSEYSAPQAYEPNKIVAEKLEPPALQISRTGMARWLQINATGYEYSIDDGAPVATIATSIQLSENQSIRVRALGDGLYFATSDYSETKVYDVEEFEPAVLPIPIVQVSKTGLATWICANAASYIYEIDGVETETRGTAVQLMPGQSIRVKALGDDTNYWDSEYSSVYRYELTLVKLETPIVQISKSGVAQWVCVNASGYYCNIDGIVTFTLASSIQLNPGSTIRIKGAGDGLNYSDSDYSESVEYEFYPESTVRTPFDRFAFRSEVIDVLNKIPNAENMEKLQNQVETLGNAVSSNAESIAAVPAMIPKKVSSLENDAQYVQKSDSIFSTLANDISKNTQAVGTKLDSTVSANILYGTNAVGIQVHYPVSVESIGSTVAQRDALGELRVADATNPASAINLKQFVDTLTELKGAPNGFATLNDMGLIPASQLPSYVDDVVELRFAAFPSTGESGKIYIDTDTNKQYRWSGTQYAEISSSLALGEVVGTAYPGDKGKANADSISLLWTQVNAISANYVKNTDYGKSDGVTAGVVFSNNWSPIYIESTGLLTARVATKADIDSKYRHRLLRCSDIDYAWKVGATTNAEEWTDDDKAAARATIGAIGATDYATSNTYGVIKATRSGGFDLYSGSLHIAAAGEREIDAKTAHYNPIVPSKLDYAVKVGVTTNTETLTDDEKASACDWLGAVQRRPSENNGWNRVYGMSSTGVESVFRVANSTDGGTIPIKGANGRLVVGNPVEVREATPKSYVDNLPDQITLTDEQKAKWRGMMGATKWYYHTAKLLDMGSNSEEAFIYFISPSPDVESFYSSKSILTEDTIYFSGAEYLILGRSDDKCTMYISQMGEGTTNMRSIGIDSGIRSVYVEEL